MTKKDTKIISEEEGQILIQKAFDKLIQDYRNSNHRKRTDVIVKAFQLAKDAHAGAKRKSGEPYILHPIAVADICCNEIGLGSTSISAALLHDVVEDTEYTIKDIEDMFGPTIAVIVDGLTKLSGEILAKSVDVVTQDTSAQLENIRRLLLTANKDIRVILVKIADRLHNMRTLSSMPAVKQAKIAAETRLFYSPLAERLGMYDIKTEFEDLSLKYDHPEEYAEIKRNIENTKQSREDLFLLCENILKKDLNNIGLNYEMHYRIKSVYSIWRKMKSKQVPFSEIYDIFAIRIIFTPTSPETEYTDIFRIYQVLASHFRLKDDRIRDWVTRPKENGYRALHITIMGPSGEWIEVQIRSRQMHQMAEKGLAAHWRYKAEAFKVDEVEERILNNVKELLSNPGPSASDDYENMMFHMSNEKMLVFTPKGDQIGIARGSTVLDFAYLIHTELGDHCIGAKVNHEMVGLDYRLSNGDQVEVITTSKTRPKETWLKFVTNPSVKRHIIRYLNKQRENDIKKGREILQEFCEKNNQDKALVEKCKASPLPGYLSFEDMLIDIAHGVVKLTTELLDGIVAHQNDEVVDPHDPLVVLRTTPAMDLSKIKETYTLTSQEGYRNYIRPSCCRPIMGEEVHGILNEHNQVVIHKRYCQVAINQKASHGNRIVNVEWGAHVHSPFRVTLGIYGVNIDFFVLNILTTLKDKGIELWDITFRANREMAEGQMTIRVSDVAQLEDLMVTLKEHNDVIRVIRIDGDKH